MAVTVSTDVHDAEFTDSKENPHKYIVNSYKVFDTAGMEKYKALGTAYYKKANICVIVYDITSLKTFLKVVPLFITIIRAILNNYPSINHFYLHQK